VYSVAVAEYGGPQVPTFAQRPRTYHTDITTTPQPHDNQTTPTSNPHYADITTTPHCFSRGDTILHYKMSRGVVVVSRGVVLKRSGGRLKQDLDKDLQLHKILILLY